MDTNNWNIPGTSVEIYHNTFIPAMIGEWVPRVLAIANPMPGERVLDVACGTGVLTRAAAEAVGPNGFVGGVDINPDMLAFAREFGGRNSPNIEWHECDAQKIPFQDKVFDIVYCELGLMFMPDRVSALREMQRVLKPGGRLGLMVWGAIEKCPGQMAMAKTWGKLFGEDVAAGFHKQHSLSDPDTILGLMEAAGVQEIDVQWEMGTMRWESAEQLVRSYGALGHFPGDAILQAAAIQEVSKLLEGYAKADGLAYPIEAILGRGTKPW